MSSIRLNKMMRLEILENFRRKLKEKAGAVDQSDESDLFDAIVESVIGKSHMEAFKSLSKVSGVFYKADQIRLIFETPPLADLRKEATGAAARMYRQTHFTIEIMEERPVPCALSYSWQQVEQLPAALAKRVKRAVVEKYKAEAELEYLMEQAKQMLNACGSVNTLKEKWPGVSEYLPDNLGVAPGKELSHTAEQIEAHIAKYLKMAKAA